MSRASWPAVAPTKLTEKVSKTVVENEQGTPHTRPTFQEPFRQR